MHPLLSKGVSDSFTPWTFIIYNIYISTAPSPPRMLTMIGTPTGSTVELNWLSPLNPNGAIRYEIEYEPARILGDPANATGIRTRFYTLSLRIGALSYNVRVVAVNNQGRASSSVLVVNCTGSERGTIATVDVHFLTSFVFNCFFSEPVPIYTYVYAVAF